MTRIASTILIMVVLLNGTAVIMEASGLSDDVGVTMETGVDQSIDNVMSQLDATFSPNINIVESFVSLALAALSVIRVVIEGVFLAPTLVKNILPGGGFVDTFVDVMFLPAYIIATLELLFMATGRDMV